MAEYCLSDFVEGYNRLNAHRFSDLSYDDIQKLMAEYGAIDPMIAQTIHDAYLAEAAGRSLKIAGDLTK